MDVLAIVRMLLGLPDNEQNQILTLFIEMTTQSILNYCNIKELPEELKFVLARMVVDLYREEQLFATISRLISTKEQSGITDSKISSISEAGRTVAFDTSQSETKQALSELQLLQNSIGTRISTTTELNKYKRLYRM